jgi:hypothetical protein
MIARARSNIDHVIDRVHDGQPTPGDLGDVPRFGAADRLGELRSTALLEPMAIRG